MAKKVILQDLGEKLLPITRGELVLDSSGKEAFHSEEFLATDSLPGLTNIHYVQVQRNDLPNTTNTDIPLIQLKVASEEVYPVTSSEAVLVNTASGTKSLDSVLNLVQVDIESSKIILDDRPTEGNTTHGVSSDGIFQELKETVGNIQILLQNI